jgi:predicted AlkP superfamily pyrophosphatase or phosphodiesterase
MEFKDYRLARSSVYNYLSSKETSYIEINEENLPTGIEGRPWYQRYWLTIFFSALLFLLILGFVLCLALLDKNVPSTLIIISLDGFRSEYLDRLYTPAISELAQEGVRAKHLQAQFPTLTFPNHYSLVTGLYPDSHGIVANTFYSPEYNDYFSYKNSSALDGKWWNGEPIWSTAARQGKKVFVVFWPGSEAEIAGFRPTKYLSYNESSLYSTKDRMNLILSYLDLPEDQKPDLILTYFSIVDSAGHMYGPDSDEVNLSLKEINMGLETLINGVDSRGLNEGTDIILVGDHGMTQSKPPNESIIYLNDYIDIMSNFEVMSGSPFMMLSPRNNSQKLELFNILKKASVHQPWNVYLKEKMPVEFNMGNSSRISDIVVLVDEGYILYVNSSTFDYYLKGTHGFSPFLK